MSGHSETLRPFHRPGLEAAGEDELEALTPPRHPALPPVQDWQPTPGCDKHGKRGWCRMCAVWGDES